MPQDWINPKLFHMLLKSLKEDDFLRYKYYIKRLDIYELQYSRMLIWILTIKSTNVNDLSWMGTISEVKSHLKFVNGNIIVVFNFMEMMTDGCFISKIESVMKFRCENLCFITAYRSFPRLFVIWCASWHFFRIICV